MQSARTKGKNSKVAEFNLGPHEFRHKTPLGGGTTTVATLPLFAVDGAPIIKRVDGNGIVHHIPLDRRYTRRCTLYVEWALPAHPLIPAHLVGAFTSIRHNSEPEELAVSAAGAIRALRVTPEHDPDFDHLMGLRSDPEKQLHPQTQYGRARGHGSRRFRLHMFVLPVAPAGHFACTPPSRNRRRHLRLLRGRRSRSPRRPLAASPFPSCCC